METTPTTYGYIVTPYGSKTAKADQIRMLRKFIPDFRNVLTDREFKTKTERTALEHILEILRPKDVLVTTKLSNLGRNYAEILEKWKLITEDRGAFIVSLEPPAVDTRPGEQSPAQTAVEFLSCLVENQEERSRKVTEGMRSARLRGVVPGKKKMERPPQFAHYKEEWQKKAISAREASKILGITHKTFLRWSRES